MSERSRSLLFARDESSRPCVIRVLSLARSIRALAVVCLCALGSLAVCDSSTVHAQGTRWQIPTGAEYSDDIQITSGGANRWQDGKDDTWLLWRGVEIRQGEQVIKADTAVLWVNRGRYDEPQSTTVYVEGNVEVDFGESSGRAALKDTSWYVHLTSAEFPTFNTPQPAGEIATEDAPILARAKIRRYAHSKGVVKQASYQDLEEDSSAVVGGLPIGTRRVRAYPRSSTPVSASYFPSADGKEMIGVIDSGENIIIEGDPQFGTVDIATDRLVIWNSGDGPLSLDGSSTQDANQPLELYMEGNVVFRQGDRILHAQRMYYDARREIGTIVAAEILTPLEPYEGLIRLKADVVQQIARDRYVATNSFVTTSRMGDPSYRLSSGTVYFEDKQTPAVDPVTGLPVFDPITGEQLIDHDRTATSLNNFVYLEDFPVGYWPIFAADLEQPSFFLKSIKFANDSIFGTQVLTTWDPYQILGIENPPPGTDWDFSVDYLSERGIGHGTRFSYEGLDLLNIPSTYAGIVDYWGIEDSGLDNLGKDRDGMTPEKKYRFKLFGRQRVSLPGNILVSSELGWISDRNFLEQYFEDEWDTFKDMRTGTEIKKIIDNSVWAFTADARINSFFTETQGIEGKHTWLGESLFADRITWYEHTKIGYRDLQVASTPEDPQDLALFQLLPWEVPASGARLSTRHELDMPLQAGPAKVVPYVMGEFAHWEEDINGDDLNRLYGKFGVRSSLSMWSVNPGVESDLFNVHGLAHKVVFEIDGSFADSSEDLTDLPLYDQIQDNSQEAMLRNAQFYTFGGMSIPQRFDDRFYAVRSGLADWVTSPSTEIAEDLAAIRMGVHQRWQTRRGFPGRRRTIDWIVLDSDVIFFPDANRDNFGQEFGQATYDFRWHVGDRLVVTSDAMMDFFGDGMRIIRVGAKLSRPPRGAINVNFSSLEGPISSQLLSLSYSYRMSPKWISSMSTSFDFGEDVNLGQNIAITRIGESFLMTFGFNVDATRDNVGVALSIEPRFLPGLRFGQAGTGARIPPAGANGIE